MPCPSGQASLSTSSRVQPREQLSDRLRDRGVLVLQALDRAGQARSSLHDLLVQAARLLGDDHVLVEGVSDSDAWPS